MAYTVLELINKAYYLSSLVAPEFEAVSAFQQKNGLDYLKFILSSINTDSEYIPFYTRYEFDTVAGQEEYFIDNLIEISGNITFNINSVRYPAAKINRNDYFSNPRVDDLTSLPWTYHAEREKGGTKIYLYFLPAEIYTIKLTGKFGLSSPSLNDDLTLTYEMNYIEYLQFLLAKKLCAYNDHTFTMEKEKQLMQIEKRLRNLSPKDYKAKTTSSLAKSQDINYAVANLGNGWWPGG